MSAQRLVGAWTLDRWRIGYSDGRAPTHPFGTDAVGLLVYSADGHMNASIMTPRRPALPGASAKSAPAEARLAAFDGFFSYGGTYSVAGDVVTHHVTVALNPNLVGTDQPRRMVFDGDTLTLAADDALPADPQVTRHHRLVWRRAGAKP